MTQVYKFDTTTDPIQRFEVEKDGTVEADPLAKNQMLSIDTATGVITLTSTHNAYIKLKTFVPTASTTDDPSYYVRDAVIYKSLDGKIINDPTANESDGNVPGDQDGDGSNDDSLQGDKGKNVINGGAGDDHIAGLSGADILHGGTGDDVMLGGQGGDVLDGGAGNDALIGDTGNDVIDGGSGTDILDGGDGNDKLFGGADNDDLYGGANGDVLDGGTGDDTLYGNSGDDKLLGGDGNDALNGGDGNDVVAGGAGNDVVNGEVGNDKVIGGDGNDTLNGGAGNDELDGGKGNDILLGGEGKDKVSGGEGDDRFLAGQDAGNDAFSGGKGTDTIDYSAAKAGVSIDLEIGIANAIVSDAGTGLDTIKSIENATGSIYDDILIGTKDANVLDGGAGNDTITGGKGSDTLTGGSGNDTFKYIEIKDSRPGISDHITDFTAGSDKIDLSAIDAIKGGSNDAFTLVSGAPSQGNAAGVVWFDASTHTLFGSIDNGAAAEFAIVLDGVNSITAADLIL